MHRTFVEQRWSNPHIIVQLCTLKLRAASFLKPQSGGLEQSPEQGTCRLCVTYDRCHLVLVPSICLVDPSPPTLSILSAHKS
jgi:hypothetical protein